MLVRVKTIILITDEDYTMKEQRENKTPKKIPSIEITLNPSAEIKDMKSAAAQVVGLSGEFLKELNKNKAELSQLDETFFEELKRVCPYPDYKQYIDQYKIQVGKLIKTLNGELEEALMKVIQAGQECQKLAASHLEKPTENSKQLAESAYQKMLVAVEALFSGQAFHNMIDAYVEFSTPNFVKLMNYACQHILNNKEKINHNAFKTFTQKNHVEDAISQMPAFPVRQCANISLRLKEIPKQLAKAGDVGKVVSAINPSLAKLAGIEGEFSAKYCEAIDLIYQLRQCGDNYQQAENIITQLISVVSELKMNFNEKDHLLDIKNKELSNEELEQLFMQLDQMLGLPENMKKYIDENSENLIYQQNAIYLAQAYQLVAEKDENHRLPWQELLQLKLNIFQHIFAIQAEEKKESVHSEWQNKMTRFLTTEPETGDVKGKEGALNQVLMIYAKRLFSKDTRLQTTVSRELVLENHGIEQQEKIESQKLEGSQSNILIDIRKSVQFKAPPQLKNVNNESPKKIIPMKNPQLQSLANQIQHANKIGYTKDSLKSIGELAKKSYQLHQEVDTIAMQIMPTTVKKPSQEIAVIQVVKEEFSENNQYEQLFKTLSKIDEDNSLKSKQERRKLPSNPKKGNNLNAPVNKNPLVKENRVLPSLKKNDKLELSLSEGDKSSSTDKTEKKLRRFTTNFISNPLSRQNEEEMDTQKEINKKVSGSMMISGMLRNTHEKKQQNNEEKLTLRSSTNNAPTKNVGMPTKQLPSLNQLPKEVRELSSSPKKGDVLHPPIKRMPPVKELASNPKTAKTVPIKKMLPKNPQVKGNNETTQLTGNFNFTNQK